MPTISAPAARNSMVKDSFWSFLSEGIAIPGLVVSAAILSRALAAEGYGQFSIAMTFAQWLQFASVTGLMRIGVQVVAKETDDWKLAAGNVMSAFLISGALTMALGMFAAPVVCSLLNMNELAPYLMIICLNVFLFSVQMGLRVVLAGLGRFKERSFITGLFWISRLTLTAALVLCGWHLWGAIVAFVGSTALAAAFGWWMVPFRLRFDKSIFLKLVPALPLLIGAVSMQLADKIDVFLIKGLGYSIADTGLFSVAKNAAYVPLVLGYSVAPVMVTAISRHLSNNRLDQATGLTRQTMNLLILTLPFGAVMATSGQELIAMVYGSNFSSAGVYLGPLFMSSIVMMVLAVMISAMSAFNCINPTVYICLAALGLSLVFLPLAIVNFGILGGAYADLAVCGAVMAITAYVAWNRLRIAFSLATLARVSIVFAIVFLVGSTWTATLPVPGLKTVLVSLLVPALYFILKEPGFFLFLDKAKALLDRGRQSAVD